MKYPIEFQNFWYFLQKMLWLSNYLRNVHGQPFKLDKYCEDQSRQCTRQNNKQTRTLLHVNNKCTAGLQIFFRIGCSKRTMEQKLVGHFLKWWAQAYQTNHSWHLGSILYLHTDTDTSMHICILAADYTVGHSKKKTNYRLIQGKSIAGWMLQGEHSAILSTSINLPFDIKVFVLSFWVAGC